uniref:Uncharacterized protein n=1 Tax=Anguilla anguilla TaxID=7936 RepID=A0A0E9WIQ1_ANGAN
MNTRISEARSLTEKCQNKVLCVAFISQRRMIQRIVN